MFIWYLNDYLVAKKFYKSLVDGVQADSMTKLRKKNPFVICKTNLLQEKINMIFAALKSVRIVKNCDLVTEVTVFHYTDLPAGK